MFTFGQISDTHLGYSSGRKRVDENGFNIRENDGYVALNKAVTEMIEEKVDAVVVTGDLFHTPRPKNHTIIIAQNELRRLALEDIPVYILAGNHDATDVRMEIPSSKLVNEPFNNIFSYSDPYVVNEIHPGVYMHFLSHHAFVDQDNTFSEVKLIPDAVNILASHGSCYDTNIGVLLRSPSEPREVIIPQEIMEMPWDYTLLGHIHERGWIGSEDKKTDTLNRKQFYGGSLLRRGFSDKVSPTGRGWTKWVVNDDKSIDVEMFTIPERPQFDMAPIRVKDKTSIEVEDEIIAQLKAIDDKIISEYGEFNLENMPIVRQTLLGVNSVTRLTLNWSRFLKYTTKHLSHQFKQIHEESTIKHDNVSIDAFNNSDMVAVFNKWRKDINLDLQSDLKDKVTETAEEFLKASRDLILDE